MAGNSESDLAALTPIYANATVKLGQMTLTVPQALAAEAAFCPVKGKGDPERRLRFLVQALHNAGSLLPEHEYLLPPQES